MKIFNKKLLVSAITTSLLLSLSATASDKSIGDLEIYQLPSAGAPTLTLMLDTSGSMGFYDYDGVKYLNYYTSQKGFAMCPRNQQGSDTLYKYIIPGTNGKQGELERYYCYLGGERRYNRISTLKQALIELLASNKLSDETRVALGYYSTNGDGKTGSMIAPTLELTDKNRVELINKVKSLTATGGTPTASGLAEAGAYMMGTTTYSEGGTSGIGGNDEPEFIEVGTQKYLKYVGYKESIYAYNPRRARRQWNDYYYRCPSHRSADDLVSVSYITDKGNSYDKVQACYSSNHHTTSKRRFPYYNESITVNTGDNRSKLVKYYLLQEKPILEKNPNYTGNILEYGDIKDYSGFPKSIDSTKASDGKTYQQGANAAQCAGNGIYLLTDGKPANSLYINDQWVANPDSDNIAAALMNKSLADSGLAIENCNTPSSLSGGEPSGAWGCMSEYAKLLRDPNNPSGLEIKIATTGFGDDFGGLPKQGEVVDCGNILKDDNGEVIKDNDDNIIIVDKDGNKLDGVSADASNLCKLGEEGYGFGEGGFTYIDTEKESAKQLISSITNFLDSLNDSISTAPSGTITIPVDPLSTTNIQPYAYLPMLEPMVGGADQIWAGNLKKYHVKNGTLFGKNNTKDSLYIKPASASTTANNSFPYLLNSNVKDVWMGNDDYKIEGKVRNDAINAGGVYAKLRAPNATTKDNVRKVYIEDLSTKTGTDTKLVELKVVESTSATGVSTVRLEGWENINDIPNPNYPNNPGTYTAVAKAYLLNFLGYNVSTDSSLYDSQEMTPLMGDSDEVVKSKMLKLNEKLATQIEIPEDETRVLGGIIHSKPKLVSYGGKFNPPGSTNAGQISNDESDRDDYLMFGSMDGALHLVKSETGVEEFAVIPRTMVQEQVEALQKGAKGRPVGQPVFGVDAPWVSKADYKIQLSVDNLNNKIIAEKVSAYGGLRMGGVGFYGLDLSNINTSPKMKFSINRDTRGFERLGQTWSEPLVSKVRTALDPIDGDTIQDVVIFGGGYDMCYEDTNFELSGAIDATDTAPTCNKKSATYGNAIYMVDADDGALVKSWSTDDMKHGIVGGITGLDRNDNGTLDHLYFADLGGNIFRIDLVEGNMNASRGEKVVKVFDANAGVDTQNHVPYRFYERPIVSFYEDPTGQRFAAVTVASGNRSSPLAARPATDANRVYTIFDRDIAKDNLYGNLTLQSVNLTTANLIDYPAHLEDDTFDRDSISEKMHTAVAATGRPEFEGWYYPLNRFDGYANVPNVKAVGEGVVLGGIYYMTAYSPDMRYGATNKCSAEVLGGSERQLYCMPYGLCNQRAKNDDGSLGDYLSKYGTGGYTRAGKGIQELALGALNANQTNTRVLIGNQSLQEQVKKSNRNNNDAGPKLVGTDNSIGLDSALKDTTIVGGGTSGGGVITIVGGDQSAALPILAESFRLVPKRWYEIQN